MNNTSTACSYNASTCYFVDDDGHCLSDGAVLDLIRKYVVPTYQEWICIALYVIVFLVGTIGNLLVIIVIQRNRSMRWGWWWNWDLLAQCFFFFFFKDGDEYVYYESRGSWSSRSGLLSAGDRRSRCDKNLVFRFDSLQICQLHSGNSVRKTVEACHSSTVSKERLS